MIRKVLLSFFFFNDTATTEIYTLSLHDALPICGEPWQVTKHKSGVRSFEFSPDGKTLLLVATVPEPEDRSEEHTSELQSQSNLVCRLLLEKKKKLQMKT